MSDDIAIRVNGLGKRYRIAHETASYKTLGETVTNAIKAPFRRLTGQAPSRSTEEFWALKDVSFEVKRGEVVGIIGRNGAGKSTLLKILSRITTPTEGTIEIHGRVGSLLEVGTGFHPELSGRENIYLSGSILGMKRSEIEMKFDEIVRFAEMEKFLDTPVKRYSSGMYVRLAFAVAAHLEPEILIIDEVLAVGDAAFQKKCLGKMGDVAKEGRTVLFVSHNTNAIEQLCSSCILLGDGNILVESENVSEVIKEYICGPTESLQPSWSESNNKYVHPWFTPTDIYFADNENLRVQMPVSRSEEIWLYVEGKVISLASELRIGYAIYSDDGILLYWSEPTDDNRICTSIRKGRNCIRSKIPVNLLNEGTYCLEFIGYLDNIKWLFEPRISAPTLFFEVKGRLSDSPYWTTKRPGLLAPILSWEQVNIEDT